MNFDYVPWWWLIVFFILGGCFGISIMALMFASKDTDKKSGVIDGVKLGQRFRGRDQ